MIRKFLWEKMYHINQLRFRSDCSMMMNYSKDLKFMRTIIKFKKNHLLIIEIMILLINFNLINKNILSTKYKQKIKMTKNKSVNKFNLLKNNNFKKTIIS